MPRMLASPENRRDDPPAAQAAHRDRRRSGTDVPGRFAFPARDIAISRRRCMPWLYLVLAGVLEVVWAVGLKYSEGFTRLWPSVITGVAMVASFWLLATALRTIPLGTGYAIWVGIGAVGTALVGMLLFKEPATVARLVCIGLILAGIVGLKLASPVK